MTNYFLCIFKQFGTMIAKGHFNIYYKLSKLHKLKYFVTKEDIEIMLL